MITATITRKQGYNAAPEGHTVEHYPHGSTVTGKVAEWAIADGAASAKVFNPVAETKVVEPTEVKRKKRR